MSDTDMPEEIWAHNDKYDSQARGGSYMSTEVSPELATKYVRADAAPQSVDVEKLIEDVWEGNNVGIDWDQLNLIATIFAREGYLRTPQPDSAAEALDWMFNFVDENPRLFRDAEGFKKEYRQALINQTTQKGATK